MTSLGHTSVTSNDNSNSDSHRLRDTGKDIEYFRKNDVIQHVDLEAYTWSFSVG